ncbi:MAG: ParB/RepB/Spo0J family partition protein [Clostridia bacterium]|nr:ParB/RepB/Spo0J family partition protein [Clostridia bacterium]
MHTEIKNLAIKSIMPNPFQPRRRFDLGELSELADSIREVGILCPVSVRLAPGGYELIAGERRLRAAGMAGLETIPAILMEATDNESAVIALIENLQRKNLNCFEEAESIYNLMTCHSITQEKVAKRLGKSQAAIANKIRLLRLPISVRHKIIDGNLTERHARALLRIESELKQLEIVQKITEGGLTVAATEKLVQKEIDAEIKEKPLVEVQTPETPPDRRARLFVNTISKTVELLKKNGAVATTKEFECDDYIEYIIRLQKS